MALKILYTGAEKYNAAQTIPANSLGGYISSSIVPNNKLNNLFPQESYFSIKNNTTTVRAIVLEALIDSTDLKIGVIRKKDSLKIILGFTLLNTNESTELIMDEQSEPMLTEFNDELYMANEADTGNMFEVVGLLQTGERLCVWIKRILDSSGYDVDLSEVCLNMSTQPSGESGFDLIINTSN